MASEIINDFTSDLPSTQLYTIIGARGSGKTVLLTEIYDYFDFQEDWVVAEVNPHRNMLEDLASALYEKGKTKHLFLKGTFDISFHGISFSIQGKEPVSSIYSVVEKMLNYLSDRHKKVFIALDEAAVTPEMKSFAHDFQTFVRHGFPVFLLMAGLYENIMSLQNDKSLTFLYRSPKLLLRPLDKIAIEESYKKELGVDESEAKILAGMTKGYGFGYQLLGHLFFDHRCLDHQLLSEFDRQLRVNAYDKIWSGISESERKIVSLLNDEEPMKTSDILSKTGYGNKNYSVFRERLINKGVVICPRNGYLFLALPRFALYIKANG